MASEDLEDVLRPKIVEHFMNVHEVVRDKSAAYLSSARRYNYVSPKNFLDFISNYKSQLVRAHNLIDLHNLIELYNLIEYRPTTRASWYCGFQISVLCMVLTAR